ncbi:MAG TPA: C-type lectin domain-containing protein [Labilithrix sp.]|nr:C-type lectin domain-containing protein [Labilithrix sp.]
MKHRAILAGGAALVAVACGGPTAGPTDPAQVVLPPQPPQPGPPAVPAPPVLPIAAVTPFTCEGGQRFDVGGRAYCAYAQPASWEAAERRCVSRGGHLMTLDTEATSKALRAALWSPLGGERAAWLGLQLQGRGAQGKWKWSSGEVLGDASWNTGEPNNFGGDEACGEWLVADGRWNDTRCNLQQGYLCQFKADQPAACRRGRAFTAGGRGYCLTSGSFSWNEAKRACATEGGALAVLRTAEDNAAVRDAMAARFSATKLWIGLTDAAEEGHWSWVSGAPLELTAWADEEPNDFHRENCGELYSDSWTWNDLDCSAELPSVCEGPAPRR